MHNFTFFRKFNSSTNSFPLPSIYAQHNSQMTTIIRSWNFKCDDIQNHKKAYCLKPNLGIECPFCLLITQHQSGTCKEESYKRWSNYFTPDRKITKPGMSRKIDVPTLIDSIDFNQKPGIAFFKEGIEPEVNMHGVHGGRHILQMFGRKDDDELAANFQKVMQISIDKIYGNKTLLASINGILIRGEVNSVMSMAKDASNYADPAKLPYMLRLEIWIPKDFEEEAMEELKAAKDEIEEEMRGMGLVEGSDFKAFKHQRK